MHRRSRCVNFIGQVPRQSEFSFSQHSIDLFSLIDWFDKSIYMINFPAGLRIGWLLNNHPCDRNSIHNTYFYIRDLLYNEVDIDKEYTKIHRGRITKMKLHIHVCSNNTYIDEICEDAGFRHTHKHAHVVHTDIS